VTESSKGADKWAIGAQPYIVAKFSTLKNQVPMQYYFFGHFHGSKIG